MEPTSAFETGADDTVRRRILVATLRLIADEGIDAVRHRRVADMADVSLGSTTYHFASRDDLIEAAFLLYLEEAAAFLDRIDRRRPPARTSASTIVSFVDDLLDREFENVSAVQAEYELILYAARHPLIGTHLTAWEDTQRAQLEAKLAAAGAARAVDGARTLFALIRGLEIERLLSPTRPLDLRRRLRPVVEALIAA